MDDVGVVGSGVWGQGGVIVWVNAAVQWVLFVERGMRLRAMTSNNQQKVRERRVGQAADASWSRVMGVGSSAWPGWD